MQPRLVPPALHGEGLATQIDRAGDGVGPGSDVHDAAIDHRIDRLLDRLAGRRDVDDRFPLRALARPIRACIEIAADAVSIGILRALLTIVRKPVEIVVVAGPDDAVLTPPDMVVAVDLILPGGGALDRVAAEDAAREGRDAVGDAFLLACCPNLVQNNDCGDSSGAQIVLRNFEQN